MERQKSASRRDAREDLRANTFYTLLQRYTYLHIYKHTYVRMYVHLNKLSLCIIPSTYKNTRHYRHNNNVGRTKAKGEINDSMEFFRD